MLSNWILLIFVLCAEAGRRHNHKRVEAVIFLGRHFRVDLLFLGVDVEFSVGTPPQRRDLKLDTLTADFVVMDVGCRDPHKILLCSQYCENARYRHIYCSPGCAADDSTRNFEVRCLDDYELFYDPANSTTFVDLREYVFVRFRNYRACYGRKASDVLQLETIKYRKVANERAWEKVTVLNLSGASFIRGLSFDRKYFSLYAMGLLGLSPAASSDHPSLVPFLKETGQIEQSVISVQNGERSDYTAFFAHPLQSVLFGALDKYSCANWRKYPAYGNVGWVFEIGDVNFAGRQWPGRHFIRIDLETSFIGIPAFVSSTLIEENFFLRILGGGLYVRPSNRLRANLEFRAGLAKATIPWRAMTATTTLIRSNGPIRYADEDHWSIGVEFLKYYCFGFDYETHQVAWADLRTYPDNRD